MKTRIIIGSVIIIVASAVAIALYQYRKPAADVVEGKPEFSLTASKLFDEFDSNEDSANAAYLNKVIEVQGNVSEVTPIDSASVNIILASNDPMFGVSCQMSASRKTNIKTGDSVSIKGLCTGMLMDVVLVKCIVVKQNLTINQ